MDRALGPRVDRKFRSAKSDLALREKKKLHRRFDSRNRPRRFPAPRSRVLTVRFATGGPAGKCVIHAKSREKHGAFVTADDAPLRDAVVSGKSNEHEPRDARSARRGGAPPARDAPRGREHAEARARSARRNHPDPRAGRQCGAPGCDVQDARAVRRGGGEDGHHARRRRRVPPLASAGTRASKFPARASRETRPTRRLYRTRNIPLSTKTATRDVAKNSQRSRDRRARTRHEARGASRREPRDVLREPRRPVVPRGAAMRPRARTARAARRHRIGRIRPFPVRERRSSRRTRCRGDGFGRLSRTLFAIKRKQTPETRPDDVSVPAADPSLLAVPHDAVLPE